MLQLSAKGQGCQDMLLHHKPADLVVEAHRAAVHDRQVRLRIRFLERIAEQESEVGLPGAHRSIAAIERRECKADAVIGLIPLILHALVAKGFPFPHDGIHGGIGRNRVGDGHELRPDLHLLGVDVPGAPMQVEGLDIGIGLGDEGVPDFAGHVLVLVAAHEQGHARNLARQRIVLVHAQVGDAKDHVAHLACLLECILARLVGVEVLEVILPGEFQRHPDEAELERVAMVVGDGMHEVIGHRLIALVETARHLVDHMPAVARDDAELALVVAGQQVGLLEVKFVVAECDVVGPQGIEHLDHVAAVDALLAGRETARKGAEQRRTQVVAIQDRDHRQTRLLQLMLDRGHAGHAADLSIVQRRNLIDIVELQDHKLDRALRLACRGAVLDILGCAGHHEQGHCHRAAEQQLGDHLWGFHQFQVFQAAR